VCIWGRYGSNSTEKAEAEYLGGGAQGGGRGGGCGGCIGGWGGGFYSRLGHSRFLGKKGEVQRFAIPTAFISSVLNLLPWSPWT